MNIALKLILTTLLFSTIACSITSCHTAEGFGEDLQAGGHAISNVAARNS